MGQTIEIRGMKWGVWPVVFVILGGGLGGCTTLPTTESNAAKSSLSGSDDKPEREQVSELKTVISALNARIDALEGRIQTMNDKFDRTSERKNSSPRSEPIVAVPVKAHPADEAQLPESTFDDPRAISDLKESMILFETGKYSEAILGFSGFLERFADHALAGVAQFYVGESYYMQKEFALALQEFQRVLTSYDRSSHVPDALRRMADVEDALKRPKNAAKYRAQLNQWFPQSPAAGNLDQRENSDTTSALEPGSGTEMKAELNMAPITAPAPLPQGVPESKGEVH